jgi:hypothetical protein
LGFWRASETQKRWFYEALRFPPPLLTYQQERGYVGSELTSVPAGKADRKSTLPP